MISIMSALVSALAPRLKLAEILADFRYLAVAAIAEMPFLSDVLPCRCGLLTPDATLCEFVGQHGSVPERGRILHGQRHPIADAQKSALAQALARPVFTSCFGMLAALLK